MEEVMGKHDRSFMVLVSVLYLVTVTTLAFLSDTSLPAVFVAMSPSLVHLIILFLVDLKKKYFLWSVWVTPLLLSLIFWLVWKSGSIPFLIPMEGPTLAVTNIFLGYLMNIFLIFPIFSLREEDKKLREIERLRGEVSEYKEQLQVTRQNMSLKLRGIEDKCKALNFVIGRVYGKKRGGTKEIREALKIPAEWYNNFSEITADSSNIDEVSLLSILEKILGHLRKFEVEEIKLFMPREGKVPVVRHPEDKVIDVLALNDKDPVMDYYQEAKEVCTKLIELLKLK